MKTHEPLQDVTRLREIAGRLATLEMQLARRVEESRQRMARWQSRK